MSTLLIDIGNTRAKAATVDLNGAAEVDFRLERLPSLDSTDDNAAPRWEEWDLTETPGTVVVSNVAGTGTADSLAAFADHNWGLRPSFIVPRKRHLGMETDYADPTRLGVDRWLAALAAWRRSDGAVAVVDFGTAVTLDVVTAEGRHKGGMIAPGVHLMRRALTEQTADLKTQSHVQISGIAANTNDAISLGCESAQRGLLNEMRTRVKQVVDHDGLSWWVTGGGWTALDHDDGWTCRHEPDLVLLGLADVNRDRS